MEEIIDLNGQGNGVPLDTGTLGGRGTKSGMPRDDDFCVQIDLILSGSLPDSLIISYVYRVGF